MSLDFGLNGWGLEPKSIAVEYLRRLTALLDSVDLDAFERVMDHLTIARKRGATIYIAGNGGSATTASHWVNDLGKAVKVSGGTPMRVMSLTDNVSWVTALANDEGYERVFAGQLENFVKPEDILIVISASGNSENLVHAVALAKAEGATTIGLLGFDGGVLKDMVTDYIWVPSQPGTYGLVESAHSVLCDMLTTCLVQDRHPAAGAAL
ncbi:MAG TPA: SIS domain-containing protein [Thermoleophilaceae bacterium]|nr:SIS domain-containing protein [Thermoleophilaceae bacterium]